MGVLLIAVGACMWVLGFGDFISSPGSYLFIFIGGMCIGTGLAQAVNP